MTYEINTAELRAYLPKLRIGDRVLLSGAIYTSRDAAHQRDVYKRQVWLPAAAISL